MADAENQLDREVHKQVLICANIARSILKTIWYRKHRLLVHVLRHDNLLHDIIEGKMLGKAIRGRIRWSYCMILWRGEIMDS